MLDMCNVRVCVCMCIRGSFDISVFDDGMGVFDSFFKFLMMVVDLVACQPGSVMEGISGILKSLSLCWTLMSSMVSSTLDPSFNCTVCGLILCCTSPVFVCWR